MTPLAFFHRLRIKYHLMLWYSALFALVFIIAGSIIFSLVKSSLEEQLHTELEISAAAMENTITTAIDVTVRNHLRAIAEKNKDILTALQQDVEEGRLSPEDAKTRAEEILLSQVIGQTGYIYAITSEGTLVVHPKKRMKNRNMSSYWLARQQKEKKEGYLEYNWQNPGEKKPRPKALYMTYFAPWDWIISASSYRDEFLSLIHIDDYREGVMSLNAGHSSYAFVLSGDGTILLHPNLSGKVSQLDSAEERSFFSNILWQKSGEITHISSSRATSTQRSRMVAFRYLEELDWIVASVAYLEEISDPLHKLYKIFFTIFLVTICLIWPLSLYLGTFITRPLTKLTAMLSRTSRENVEIETEETAMGEVGILATHFNHYMRRLRRSGEALEGEVSDRLRAEQQLKLFAKVFENALEGISITDAEGNIVAVNQSFTTITGYSKSEAIGQNPRILKSNKHGDDFYAEMWTQLKDKGHWSGEIWNRRKNGEAFPEILSISAIRTAESEVSHYVAVFHDITEMKLKEEQIKYQAYHDALTGLPNRALAADRLKMSLANARRKGTKIAVFFMDMDNFKHINDSLGHAAGDVLLQQVGERLSSLIREEDTVARLGGDEFQIISIDITEEQQVVDLANRLIAGFSRPFKIEGHNLFVTMSIGGAISPDDGETAAALTKNADTAMYQAKQQGKNTFALFTKELSDQARRRLQLEADFRRALQKKEFTVFYQPKVQTASGRTVAVEALVRWRKPDGTLVNPADFIPLAEETGLIIPLGDYVLSSACHAVRQLEHAGHHNIKVAVNLAPTQFEKVDMVDSVKATLAQNGLPASQLELEITESTMMTDLDNTIHKLHQLVKEGMSISIDDFGTGHSSLYYLKTFPIDTLKIDRSFVQEITMDATDAQIVETIVLMARNLGISVVAEGVETDEQLQLLKAFGCEFIQGYYYSPPVPLAQLMEYLDNQ